MKITIKKLFGSINTQGSISDKNSDTKLKLGLKKHNFPDYEKVLAENFTKPLNKKRLSLALLDADGGVIINEKGEYKFGREETQQIMDYVEELNDKEVDFDFYVTDFSDLSEEEKKTFMIISTEDPNTKYLDNISEEVFNSISLFIKNLPPYKSQE